MNSIKLLYFSLCKLAWDKPQQEDYLKSIGTYPLLDELALEFDDAYKLFKANDQKTILLLKQQRIINQIDELNGLLEAISGTQNSKLWEAESLTNLEWCKIRTLAQSIVESWPSI